MAFNPSQGNCKDYEQFTGFGGIFDAFPANYSFDAYSTGPDLNAYSFDDTINQCLSLQNDEEDHIHNIPIQKTLFLNNKFINNDPPTLTGDDSTTTTSSNNDKSIASTSDMTPMNSLNSNSFFPFPSNMISATIADISQSHKNNINPSPGSTVSTSSVQPQLHGHIPPLQPKSEPIANSLWFQSTLPINRTNTNYNLKPEMPMNMMHVPSNREHREAILREFMNGYNESNKHSNSNNKIYSYDGHNAHSNSSNSMVVPPSYTQRLCDNMPINIPVSNLNGQSPLPPLPSTDNVSLSLPPHTAYSYAPPPPHTKTPQPRPQRQRLQQRGAITAANHGPPHGRGGGGGGKKYECPRCPKKFKHHSNLKIHAIVHTPEALVCGYCSKKFARKTNLKQHERVHTGERPFECTICNRKFKQKHSLKDHIKIHTGEKPFVCQFCSKSFKIKHNLTLHIRTHNNQTQQRNEKIACNVCSMTFYSIKDLKSHQFDCSIAKNIIPY